VLRLLLRLLVALLAVLTLVGLTTVQVPAATAGDPGTHPEWGTTSAADRVLRHGCRGYRYTYALTPPDGDWALETFLVGPHGKQLGSGYFMTGADPLSGTGTWRLCHRPARSGTYTIRARLTTENGADHYDGWLPDSSFRLHKPRRH
jgi:hypothetical protein